MHFDLKKKFSGIYPKDEYKASGVSSANERVFYLVSGFRFSVCHMQLGLLKFLLHNDNAMKFDGQ